MGARDGSVQDLISRKKSSLGFNPSEAKLTYFRVTSVNAIEGTVDIEFAHSRTKEKGVSYLTPFSGAGAGIKFTPTVGDVGIVATTSLSGRVILGFLDGPGRIGDIPLGDGEVAMKTSESAFFKQDAAGNMIFLTDGGTLLMLGRSGLMASSSKSFKNVTEAEEAFSGLDENGEPVYLQDFFENARSVDFSDISELANAIMTGSEIKMAERNPILKIHSIRKKADSEDEKIEVEFSNDDPRIVYEVEVVDPETQEQLSAISFDRNGNVKIRAKKLILDVENVENR